MITPFRLPVTDEQNISLIYQQAEGLPAPEETPKTRTGPLIVMMHDFPGSHMSSYDDLFGDMAYHFSKLGYPSVRFDFRGGGESDCTAAEFSLESAVADLDAVLDWAKHDKKFKNVVLMGAGVAAAAAVMGYRPKFVSGLVLLWPSVVMRDTGFKELFTREKLLEAAEMDAPFVEYRGYRLGSHFVHEIYNTDLTSSLERIKAPVLIQAGTNDPDIPLEQSYYARDHVGGLVDLGVFEGGKPGLPDPKMRKHLYVNIEHFLSRVLKRLASPPKT